MPGDAEWPRERTKKWRTFGRGGEEDQAGLPYPCCDGSTMKNFEASGANGTPLYCLVCEREIPHQDWFARIRLGKHRLAVCRPCCAERYLDAPADYSWRLGLDCAEAASTADQFNHGLTPASSNRNGLFEWFARDKCRSLTTDLFPPGPKPRQENTRSCEFVFVRGLPLLAAHAAAL